MSFLILSIYLSYPFKNLSYICALDEDILKLLTVFTNLGLWIVFICVSFPFPGIIMVLMISNHIMFLIRIFWKKNFLIVL